MIAWIISEESLHTRSALPPRSTCSAGPGTPSAILKLFQLVSPGARLRIVL
jgi:hypothetical protein